MIWGLNKEKLTTRVGFEQTTLDSCRLSINWAICWQSPYFDNMRYLFYFCVVLYSILITFFLLRSLKQAIWLGKTSMVSGILPFYPLHFEVSMYIWYVVTPCVCVCVYLPCQVLGSKTKYVTRYVKMSQLLTISRMSYMHVWKEHSNSSNLVYV